MSISPLDPTNQTTTIPNSLLGYSSNGVSAIEITATNITLAGNLNTTPIYVEISASSGLQTTNPTGLDVNCDFNMNQNNITNVASIIQEGNDLFINNGSSALDINISAGSVLNLTGEEIGITSTNLGININAYDGIGISSATSGITIATNGGTIGSNANGGANTMTGGNVGIYSTTGGVEISAVADSVNIITPQTTWFNLTTELTGDGSITCSNVNAPPTLPLTIATDDILFINTGNNTQINAVSSFTAVAGDNIILTATNDAMTLSADDDITISSVSKGVLINGGTGDAGTNDIVLTTQNATLVGNIVLNSGGDIQLNAPNGAVISINSDDNTQVDCGENFFVQTNGTTGLINLTTGDLFNGGGIKWNTYPMGITFFNKWNGGFNYSTPNAWEMVRQNSITFPPQFLYGTYAVSFSINCSNVGSQPADKGLAMYFNFIDGGSVTYNGFSYNQSFPYANWFNASGYTNTSQTPLSITYTDYFDFNGAVNNLELQINWYADNPQPQNDFFVSTTFTLMTLI